MTGEIQALQLHAAILSVTDSHNNGFALGGAAAEVAANQGQARPTMDAVAINSSNKANDTWPDTP